MGKRFLSLFLAVTMILSAVYVSAYAISSQTPVGWEYSLEGNNATITAYNGSDANVTVPASIDSYAVTNIGEYAFKDTPALIVNLQQGITTISENAFSGSSVGELSILYSCTSIADSTFKEGIKVYGIANSAANTYCSANSINFTAVADKYNYETYVGKTIALTVPNDAALESLNNKVSVSGKNIKGISAGSDELKITLSNGIFCKVKVNVKEAPKSISNVPASLKLYINEKYQLKSSFSNGKYDETFSYSTSAASVAAVSAAGLITAKSKGTADITVSSAGLKAVSKISVLKKPTSVSLSKTDLLLGVGESKTLTYKLGANETAKSAVYSSSNTKVATVASNGKITAKAVGTSTITLTLDTGATAKCVLTVGKAPSSIKLNITKITLGVGEKIKLTPSVNSGAVCSTYIWKSITPSVATVDANGNVTAKKAGTVNIAVYPYNYNSKSPVIRAIAVVTVKKAPTSLSYQKSKITLGVGEKYDLNMVFPAGTASYHNVTKMENTSIATVAKNIIVTGKSVGKTQITTKTFNNKVAKCEITVKKAPVAVACKPTSVKLALKQSYQLKPYVNPTSACSTYKYKSSNSKVCSVSSTGKVTAKDYGACNVYIYTYNHNSKNPVFTKVTFRVGYITNRISSFTTNFDPSMTGKAHNLKLACKYINGKTDGYILQPGQVFSYNAAVGPRTTARGFKEGMVISGNGYTPGIGGGICQGATTVFNAVLFANLKVVERHNHNLKSSYVAVGRDATVYWGVQDMKFRNNYNTPIRIKMTYNAGGTINCAIYTLKKVKVPKINLKVSYSGGTYTLRRYAGGKVNYTANSRYAN